MVQWHSGPRRRSLLNELVDVLLHDAHTLAPGERELIATYVSSRNDCYYCQTIHGAIAALTLTTTRTWFSKLSVILTRPQFQKS